MEGSQAGGSSTGRKTTILQKNVVSHSKRDELRMVSHGGSRKKREEELIVGLRGLADNEGYDLPRVLSPGGTKNSW